jgi:hypothetical protein
MVFKMFMAMFAGFITVPCSELAESNSHPQSVLLLDPHTHTMFLWDSDLSFSTLYAVVPSVQNLLSFHLLSDNIKIKCTEL